MEKVLLELKASHFNNSNYISCYYCPIANAARELFKAKYINEGVCGIVIEEAYYNHPEYNEIHFRIDMDEATNANFSNDVTIRTIELTPYKSIHD